LAGLLEKILESLERGNDLINPLVAA